MKKTPFMKKMLSTAAPFLLMSSVLAGDTIADGFANPPDCAKPRVYWHWMNGNVSKEGITADLESMKDAGIGGALLTSVFCGRLKHGDVKFNSPEWDECVLHAARECERLGLELCINHTSGMSDVGGPWVAPSNSMFHLCCGETRVKGGQTFKGRLPRTTPEAPEAFYNNWYRDIATLAFPLPAAEASAPAEYEVRKSGGDRIVTAGGEPFTLRGVSFTVKYTRGGKWYRRLRATVAVSDDGMRWKDAATFDTLIYDGGKKNYQDRPVFAAFSAPATGRFIRIRPCFDEGGDAEFAFFAPEARLGVENLDEKFIAVRDAYVYAKPLEADRRSASAAECVASGSIVDLTDRVGAGGTLEWTAPAGGPWVVLRIGYRSTGRMIGAPAQSGKGLEVDKLDADAVTRHFNAYVAKYAGESAVTGIENDSWENGSQNWTHGLEKKFEKRFGYSLIPYLAALSGRIVDSPAKTDEVLRDFRRLVSDAFCENFARTLARLAHEHGMKTSMEPCGNSPANTLDFADEADLPMCEFWVGDGDGIDYLTYPNTGCFTAFTHYLDAKTVSSVVHLKGSRFVDSEAFTAIQNFGGRWLKDPFGLKAMGDLFYTFGVNRCIYHRWAHQPWQGRNPGMTMGRWGTHFERTETWWPLVGDWLKYQTRCQYLLQQGSPANDVLVFTGDAVPDNGRPEAVPPDGTSWDVCGPRQLQRLTVKDGLVSPNGYKALIVPRDRPVSPESARKLEELKAAGARIVRTGEDCGVAPDFVCADKNVRFIRRRMDDGRDFYFVASSCTNAARAVCSFRQKGRWPQLWDAESGRRLRARDWKWNGDRTEVGISFKPCGSWFVVFADSEDASLPVEEAPLACETEIVEGAWDVEFPVGWYTNGADVAVKRLDRLVSWTELPESDFKYFSGIAAYGKTIEIPQGAGRVWLDLGEVKNVAEVTVEGKTFPVLWRPPYRVEITEALAARNSESQSRVSVKIRVANLWPNRLIGDAREPGNPHTFATWEHWKAKDELLPSGILGPVKLEVQPAPFAVVGDWAVKVAHGGTVAVLAVDPPSRNAVADERCETLPVFDPKAYGWKRGARLNGIRACECTVRFALDVPSLKVRSASGGPDPAKDADWRVDPEWGTLGWTSEEAKKRFGAVLVSYCYVLRRLDSVVRRSDGTICIRKGTPHIVAPRPPALSAGDTLLGNIFVDARTEKLRRDNLFPATEPLPAVVRSAAPAAARLLPRTWQKLASGERVVILAWGDSVTDGFYLPDADKWQMQFVRRLRRRFPKAEICLLSNGWPGKTSNRFLVEPPESRYNFERAVAGVKADLVISEFVNDCKLKEEIVKRDYPKYLEAFRAAGSEWIVMTPHYVRPDWMGLKTCQETDDDPRAFVKALRSFAAENGVALADVSRRWGHLWREGIPFSAMYANDINHPVAQGMAFFADALMELFGGDGDGL